MLTTVRKCICLLTLLPSNLSSGLLQVCLVQVLCWHQAWHDIIIILTADMCCLPLVTSLLHPVDFHFLLSSFGLFNISFQNSKNALCGLGTCWENIFLIQRKFLLLTNKQTKTKKEKNKTLYSDNFAGKRSKR